MSIIFVVKRARGRLHIIILASPAYLGKWRTNRKPGPTAAAFLAGMAKTPRPPGTSCPAGSISRTGESPAVLRPGRFPSPPKMENIRIIQPSRRFAEKLPSCTNVFVLRSSRHIDAFSLWTFGGFAYCFSLGVLLYSVVTGGHFSGTSYFTQGYALAAPSVYPFRLRVRCAGAPAESKEEFLRSLCK